MHPNYFFCTRREMLVAKDLSDCIGCPLRELTVEGQLTICQQYTEAAQNKLKEKMGISIPKDQTPPDDIINGGLI